MSALLLHSCCAPCTTMVFKHFCEEGFAVKSLFYNPNIQPSEEFERRRSTMEEYASRVGLEIVFKDSDIILQEKDCINCYTTRLSTTAQMAAELGFEGFSTTLLISPYQKHELLQKIGEDNGAKYGVKFYYCDFRPDFYASQKMAKELGLYRQKYCGCGGV
ncbi:MAG: epoxyqueuosine reductase QueH [Candidatus Margulisiibacteriota bacterium]